MPDIAQTQQSTGREISLSPTVEGVSNELAGRGAVSAVAFASAILRRHPEYGNKQAAYLTLEEPADSSAPYERPVEDWLNDIREIVDPGKVPELHGRIVIVGLSLLDEDLGRQLLQRGILSAIEGELREPLTDVLTDRGRDMYEALRSAGAQPHQVDAPQAKVGTPRTPRSSRPSRPSPSPGSPGSPDAPPSPDSSDPNSTQAPDPPAIPHDQGQAISEISDSVPVQSDDALAEISKDQLGRDAFARFLAARIAAIQDQQRAYSIHLNGPWGVGKTTVLNFLRAELKKDGQWLVVDFNAWQHQHIQPSWWSLMDRVFQDCKKQLTLWDRIKETWWRLTIGRLHYILGMVVLAWLVILGLPLLARDTENMSDAMKAWANVADSLAKILAVLATIWAGVQVAGRSLLGSAQDARTYQDKATDPMNEIVSRFNTLIRRLAPRKVAIFVDDLDRCQSSYVIELLEGIQTLFREAPILFVIAADRRWINACFEEVYKPLVPLVHEPGKPLGTLFLEKAFQFSTSVPGIGASLKYAFWRNLLQLEPEEALNKINEARQRAEERIAGKTSEGEMIAEIEQSKQLPAVDQRAVREAAAVRLAAPEVVQRTENTLAEFAPLLEPNPRAMKRLVNAYSVNRALAILSEVDIERKVLARWTILAMRWPRLAEYLEEHPEMIEAIGNGHKNPTLPGVPGVPEVPEDLQTLLSDSEVAQVAGSGAAGDKLSKEIVRLCALIHA